MNRPPPRSSTHHHFQSSRGGSSSGSVDEIEVFDDCSEEEAEHQNSSHVDANNAEQQQAQLPSSAATSLSQSQKEAKSLFNTVATVATMNMILNVARPDDAIAWPIRLPRVLWEFSIANIARRCASKIATTNSSSSKRRRRKKKQVSTSRQQQSSQQSSLPSPSTLLLLAIMLTSTGITDVFIWAPLFSAFVQFQTCSGGFFTGEAYQCYTDPMKGYGRLVVVVQSLLGGLLYLLTGIAAYNAYSDTIHQNKLNRHVQMVEKLNKRQEQLLRLQLQQQRQQQQQEQHRGLLQKKRQQDDEQKFEDNSLWKSFFNTD